MIEDLIEVYDFVFLPDGQKLYKPEICPSCQSIITKCSLLNVSVCNICGHLYEESSNTQDRDLGQCWCEGLVRNGYIEKVEDYKEFFKKCLLDSLPSLERIGVTCKDCKCKKECEDGGTDIKGIIQTIGCCIDVIL